MCCKSHFPSSSWFISHILIDFPRYSPRAVRFSGESGGNIQSNGTVLYSGQPVCSNNADVTWECWALRRSRSWGECTIFKSGLPGSLAPSCGLSMSAHDWNPPLNLCWLSAPLSPDKSRHRQHFYYDRFFFFTLLPGHFNTSDLLCNYKGHAILNVLLLPHWLRGKRVWRLLGSLTTVENKTIWIIICYTYMCTLYVMSVHILWPADTHKPFRASRKRPVRRNYSAPRTAPVALLSTVRQGAQRSFRDRGFNRKRREISRKSSRCLIFVHSRTHTHTDTFVLICLWGLS